MWGTNIAQKYTVNMHYPKNDADFENLTNISDVVKTKSSFSGIKQDTRYYTELIDTAKTQEAARMHINDKYVFDGWYSVTFNNAGGVESYFKLSSNLNYRARVTQDLNLYAAFRLKDPNYVVPKGAATLCNGKKDSADVYCSNDGTYYRFNTTLNIYGCKANDSDIEKVGVVYVKSPTNEVSSEAIKTAVESSQSAKGTFTVGGSNCLFFTYTASEAGLTSHNRTQFILNVKEEDVVDGEKYDNVRAYTVFKLSDTWYISDNSVEFENGVPTQGYIVKE